MAYASPRDVEDILPEDEDLPEKGTDPEPSRGWRNLTTALEEATDLVIGYLQRTYTAAAEADGVPGDVPGAVRRVVARVALRGFMEDPANPEGVESEVNLMGPFSHTVNWGKGSEDRTSFLTRGEEERLAPYRLATDRQAGHVAMYCAPRYQ